MTPPRSITKATTQRLRPKLRFPEFRRAAGWAEQELRTLADPVSERADNEDTNNILTLSAEQGLVLQSEYFGKQIAGTNAERYLRIQRDDFVYNDRVTKASAYGTIKRLKNHPHGIVSPIYKCFRFREGELPSFWECYFEAGAHELQLRSLANEGARAGRFNVSIERFLSTSVWAPDSTSAEQPRIASCLSSLDDLIAAERQKLDALKAHKKGLMQQLFPCEGETLPRLRFPEFLKAGEWEEIELGRRMDIKGRIGYRGYTTEDIVSPGDGAISLSPSNIDESGSLTFRKATYISWSKYKESPEIMVEKGFTILVKTGSTYGKAAFVRDLPQECTVNPQIVVLKPSTIDPFFLFLLVTGEVIQSRIQATVVGGAIPTLSQESISKFRVHVPSPYEQHRIATCLSCLDDLIAAQSDKIEVLKTHKNGLRQQLFPSPENGVGQEHCGE